MIFTKDEIEILIEVLSYRNSKEFGLLKPKVAANLRQSSLNKLRHFSPRTSFTKQEFTLMAMAVHSECYFCLLDNTVDDELQTLRDKLFSLAEAPRA